MLRKLSISLVLALVFSAAVSEAAAQERTVIRDRKAAAMLLGKHKMSLQWISWDYFGTATVTNSRGVYRIKGEQKGRGAEKGAYVMIDGVIRSISAREFVFDGRIETYVNHINSGNPCVREGEMAFAITGKRKYWRLQQMQNPCDEVTDYVDIYFRGA
ncbi:MAG: hypothetical protein IPM50_05980 [Acidobacteriota bacterium]|nr:MAG: hypothetical protein IPM50_05980 [Acidobacteriota bacterium]